MYTNFLYPHARNKFLSGDMSWSSLTQLTEPGSDPTNRFYVMLLNAGVGTNTIYSGTGVTGYAAEPNAYPANWAGWSITSLGHIPFNHRTYYDVSTRPQFGGTAATSQLITYNRGNGVAAAANETFLAVPSGSAVSAFVIYRRPADITVAAASTLAQDYNSDLVAYFGSAIGMPVNGNGGDITIQWDTTDTTRVFRL